VWRCSVQYRSASASGGRWKAAVKSRVT
jgi:hypothetical protein